MNIYESIDVRWFEGVDQYKNPPRLVNNIKRKRRNKQINAQVEQSKPDATVVIPYVPTLSEKIMKLGKVANIRVVYKTE
jgi:hypothetical protein